MKTKPVSIKRLILTASIAVLCAFTVAPARADTVTYEQNANGQAYSYPEGSGFFPNNNSWEQSQQLDGSGNITAPSNWSSTTFPNDASHDVVINTAPAGFAQTVLLEHSGLTVTIGNLTVTNGASVGVQGGTLVVSGLLTLSNSGVIEPEFGNVVQLNGDVIDNSAILINGNDQSESQNVTAVTFGGGTVSGTGSIIISSFGLTSTNGQLNGTLTQAAGHTISGYGVINAALTNNGLVNANVSGGTLELHTNNMTNMTNNATMEATNGGVLFISNITVTQGVNGQLLANGGNVTLGSNVAATIRGGALNSSGGGVFIVTDAIFDSLTNNATINMPDTQPLSITGNLTNNGTIVVDSNQGSNANGTNLSFNGGTVSGTGTILLNQDAFIAGTLTQASGHTISGQSEIDAALTNNGLVNANVSGGTLKLQTNNMTNNNVMEATNGGVLFIKNITVTQGVNGQVLANGGNVTLGSNVATTISGGALNSSGGGVFIVTNAIFDSLTNNATVNEPQGSALSITGNLTNNGTISIDSDQVGNANATALSFNGGTVSGTGTILLNKDNTAALTGTLTQAAGHTISGQGGIIGALTNNGLVNANVSGKTLSVTGTTTNGGTMQASNGGTLSISSGKLTNLSGTTLTGGTYEADASSTISLPGSVTTNAATVTLNGAGSNFSAINSLASNQGSFTILNGRNFTTAGALANSGTLTTGTSSTLTVNGALNQTWTGTLSGVGAFAATTFTLAGTVAPGDAPGALTLNGPTAFNPALALDLALGSTSDTNDHLNVNGNFTLAGTLNITALDSGFGDGIYDIIDYSGGTFTNNTLTVGSAPAGYTYQILTNTPGQVDLSVTGTPEPGSAALLTLGAGAVLGWRRRASI